MEESKIKLAQQDIDDALLLVEKIEESLNSSSHEKDGVKEKFSFLCSKLQEIESLLKEEGILE